MRNLALSEHRPVWGSATGNMKSRKSILIWHTPVRGSILSLHRVCASISAGSDLKWATVSSLASEQVFSNMQLQSSFL